MSDRYSDTALMLQQWYLMVMRDRHASLSLRIESAAKLLELWPDQFPDTYHLTPADLTFIINQGIEAADVSGKNLPKPALKGAKTGKNLPLEPQTDVQDQSSSVLDHLDQVKGWH